ncbi:MAG: hypothetical protein ACM3IK_10330 [Sphingomonadaceae bacterium]
MPDHIDIVACSAECATKCYRSLARLREERERMAGTDLEHMQMLPDSVRAANLRLA